MNKIEKQILENQLSMSSHIAKICDKLELTSWELKNHMFNTECLLKPTEQDEECSDGLPKEFVNSGLAEKECINSNKSE